MKITIAAALLAAGTVLAATACEPPETSADPNLTSAPASKPAGKTGAGKASPKSTLPDGTHLIAYKISGSASSAMMTYTTPSGQEQTTKSIPWHKSFEAKDGELLSISAQNKGESGTVTCQIAVDGRIVKKATSSGAYAIASCDAALGY